MKPSIARRLTLSVGAIAAVVFTVVGTLLYLALERELLRRETEELTGRMNFVRHLLTEVPDLSSFDELTHYMDDKVASYGNLRAWITTAEGGIIYGGTPPAAINLDSSRPFLLMQDGTPMRAVAERLAPTAKLPGLRILIAMDTRPSQRVLTSFGLTLAVLCLGGGAAMLLLGAWVAWRGLAPVSALSSQAHAIGPQALSQRLPERGIPAELVVLAQSFNRVLDRLEQAYRQLEAFNADVAHELRTPLMNLIGSTEVTLSRGRSAEELRDVLASNLEELTRMKTIVNDMLFLARADRGERAAGATVALDEVARDVAEFFESVLDERGVSLKIEGAANVTGDGGLLRRAVTNLVSNALRYTAAGDAIHVVIANWDDSVSVRVRNPGATIPSDHLPHIFDRFYRGDPARSGCRESHGLGLAIVKAIVQMHGGTVHANSYNGFTEVGFSLPRRMRPQSRHLEDQPSAGGQLLSRD